MSTQLRRNLSAYGFMTPWLLGIVFLTVGSMAFSIYLSFTNYDLLSSPRWVGLQNFHQIITQDSYFWASIRATFLYVVISVPCRLIFSLFIALILNQNIRGISAYRALFYLPSLLGNSVGVAIGWRELFDADGPINTFLRHVGLNPPDWLADPHYAIYVICLLSVWQFGSEMVIFLAGIKQIPDSFYEASKIDGANAIQRFLRITLPMLSPIIFFNLVMGTISAFMVFTQVFVLTDGGPANSTLL
ncbi:carbohydrate ABC transporter permease, partial [Alicyclobacillus shizuokensis]|uniref:carbohydrate ABC transporter permease n=1 Tax=Alicyclobacillus shizuokensis TaxID=392014 RepID=UPI000835F2CA